MPATKQAMENKELKICTERLDFLDGFLKECIEKDLFFTIIVRAHRYGVPIYEASYGENTKPYGVKQDTMSCFASVTKTITGALMVKLQEDAVLDLVDPVRLYLPEFDGLGKEDICLWHLLTHSSGIEDDDFRKFFNLYIDKMMNIKKPEDGASEEEWTAYHNKIDEKLEIGPVTNGKHADLEIMKMYKPFHKPRDTMSYCNTGFTILGYVIERVTGLSLDDYARKTLFEPLKMEDSHFVVPKEKFGRMLGRKEGAMGYPWINSEQNYTKHTSAAGGLKSTVIDICHFADMVLMNGTVNGKRVLSPASVRTMIQNHNKGIGSGVREGWDTWGLGWNLHGIKKDDAGMLRSASCVEHGGWAGHKILADPETGLSCAVIKGEYDPPGNNPFGHINNVLYSALD